MNLRILGLIVGFAALGITHESNAAARIDRRLAAFARGTTGASHARVLGLFDLVHPAMPSDLNRGESVRMETALINRLQQLQHNFERALSARSIPSSEIRIIESFWINQSIALEVSSDGLRRLATLPGITKIYSDEEIAVLDPEPPTPEEPAVLADEPSWAWADMGLDRVIQETPAVNGEGVLLGSVDTGVDSTHPAVQGKIAFFYDVERRIQTPGTDQGSHGTHTTGTILGGNRTDVRIGVAPAAKLVAVGPLSRSSARLHGMQVLIDPDRDPQTADFPRAINNSWNSQSDPDVEPFYRAIEAWLVAGILPVFSAGNSGPEIGSITRPHEHPECFAVGATSRNGLIAEFSSRGPGMFHGQETQKPDITAPGDEIRSSVPGGEYRLKSGTSMATPQVTGTVGLLLQVAPLLTPDQLKQILIRTAAPRNEDGTVGQAGVWNRFYGFGKLDVYRAVQAAREIHQEMIAPVGEISGLQLLSPESLMWRQIARLGTQKRAARFVYSESAGDQAGWVTLEQL